MKRGIIAVFVLMIGISMLAADNLKFDAEKFQSRTILACFDRQVIGNRAGSLDYMIENGTVRTGIPEFDNLSRQHGFIGLEQLFDFITDLDWNNNGVYLQNIYRISLADNKSMESALTDLQKCPPVLYAEYEAINRYDYIPNDPMYSQQWHLPRIQCEEAWNWVTGSQDVIIGIVDSGVMWNHPDLQANIWVNEAELNSTTYGGNPMTINWTTGVISGGNGQDDDGNGKIDDCLGWNFYYNNNSSYQSNPENDHGTHVAGCAAAVGDNGIGVSGVSMIGSILVSTHRGSTGGTTIINGYDGILYCAQTGAHIINCSWGGPGNASTANNVVNYAVSQGALVVGSAGNDAWSNDTNPSYPNDCVNALCVAATDQSDVITYFSNYGTPIDVSAPGINIRSTVIGGSGYASYQGTSMSSPIVAGVAAVVLAVHPELEPLELKSRIEMTTDDINDINPDYAGLLGTGRVNVYQAALYDLIPNLTIEDFNFYEFAGDGDGIPNPGETCNLELNIWNNWFSGGLWSQADDVTVTVSSEEPLISFVPGTDVYTIPVIYQAGSNWNMANPVQIITPDNICLQEFLVSINITANQSSAFPYEVTHEIILQMCYEQDGWPVPLGGASSSSAALADILNNGQKQVIFGDPAGNIHLVNPDGTENAPFPVNLGGAVSNAVAVDDINGNGYQEIVAATDAGTVYVIDRQGNTILSYATGNQIKGNPMIADLDGNGSKEIIVMTFAPAANLYVIDANGLDWGSFPLALTTGGILSSGAIADLDGDGHQEIISVSVTGNVSAISSNTAANLDGWPVSIGMNAFHGPTVSNIDDDPEPEVLAVTANGIVYAINHDGFTLFTRPTGETIKSGIVTGDLDNNGSIETIFTGTLGSVYILNNQGADFTGFPVTMNAGIDATPILADMDNNGTLEIIFGDNSGYLHSLTINGDESVNFPVSLGSSLKVCAAIGDLDADGDAEIVLPNQSSYFAIDYKNGVPISNSSWSCFKRNNQRTGNALDATTSSDDSWVPDLPTSLGNNYPNPFNPETRISFTVSHQQHIDLSIYNVKGQLLRTLVNGEVEKGSHQVYWNGTDDQGQRVSSGIYLYRLKSTDKVEMQKMMLLK